MSVDSKPQAGPLHILRVVCTNGHELDRVAYWSGDPDEPARSSYLLGRRSVGSLLGHFCRECQCEGIRLVDEAWKSKEGGEA